MRCRVLPPLRGWCIAIVVDPWLAPWALFCRRSAAGGCCDCCGPMACAMGFILSPLRGWGVLRWLWTHGLRHGLYSIAAPRLGKRGLDWWWLDGGGFLTRAGVNAGV